MKEEDKKKKEEKEAKRIKIQTEKYIKKNMNRLMPPQLTPENTNTPILTATIHNNTWVYHNLFTADRELEDDDVFHNCTFIHDVTNGPNGDVIIARGQTAKMVVYADETKTLYIYKGDGKVYVFNTGTTLFGMKVEEEDE
jgi:hypothetical protein